MRGAKSRVVKGHTRVRVKEGDALRGLHAGVQLFRDTTSHHITN